MSVQRLDFACRMYADSGKFWLGLCCVAHAASHAVVSGDELRLHAALHWS